MGLDRDSLDNIPTCYASCSIGCKPEDTLPKKLDAIADAGFQQIELSFPDIQSFASLHLRRTVQADEYDDLCAVCGVIKAMCDAKGLKILMLQPFGNFEGFAKGSAERKDAFARAEGWIRLMEAAGTDMVQVGSTDTAEEKIGNDRSRFVADLRELAQMLDAHDFRLAYENWCWSTHAPTWRDVWEIVKEVDMPNVGLCLDTFQTAAYEWGDPTTDTGLLDDPDRETRFRQSMRELSASVPADKIFLLQISDAYRLQTPLSTEPDAAGSRSRRRWSDNFRPLPYDGGYLPVADVTRAVLETGFRGVFSYEVFDSGPDGKGKTYEMHEFARNAMESHRKLLDACADAS